MWKWFFRLSPLFLIILFLILCSFDFNLSQPKENFAFAQTCKPVDAILVMDKSGSMQNTISGEPKTKMESAKESSNNFIDLLGVNDHIGVVSFSDGAVLNQQLTDDKTLAKNAVSSLVAGGGTWLDKGINKAWNEFDTRGRLDSPKAMIILTDGKPDNVVSAQNEAMIAKNKGIKLIIIGYDIDSTSDPAGTRNILKSIASTLSDYYEAPTTADLQNIYNQLAAQMCDANPPVIAGIARLPSGTVFSADAITITSTATDNQISDWGLEIHRIEWTQNNWATTNSCDSGLASGTKINTFNCIIGPFASGTEIKYRSYARDLAQYETYSGTFSFRVAAITLTAGNLRIGQPNTITVQISDPEGRANLDKYYIEIESPPGGAIKISKTEMACAGTGFLYNCSFTFTPLLSEGWDSRANIIIYPWDIDLGFHNSPAAQEVDVIFDNIPPSVSISRIPSDPVLNTDTIALTSTASDESGLQNHKILYWVNGVQQPVVQCWFPSCTGNLSNTIGPYPAGTTIKYQAEATDNWNNTALTLQSSFTVYSAECHNADRTPKANLTACTGGKCCGGICDTSFSCSLDDECHQEICSGASWTCQAANLNANCCAGTSCDGCYSYSTGCTDYGGGWGCEMRDYSCNISGGCTYSSPSQNCDQCEGTGSIILRNYRCGGGVCDFQTPKINCWQSGNWDGDSIACNCNCGGYDVYESLYNYNCTDNRDNDCDGLLDCQEPACDNSAPTTSISAYDNEGVLIPRAGDAGDTKTNQVSLSIASFENVPCPGNPDILYQVRVFYNINNGPWNLIFNCLDSNSDGKCDSDSSKFISGFSVEIPVAGFSAGTRVGYRSEATDNAPVPNTGYDESFFNVISLECQGAPDLSYCSPAGRCCAQVCDTSFDCSFDNECRQEICSGTSWTCQTANAGNSCSSGDWARRKPIEIDNTLNSSKLEDYQVKIEVPYDNGIQLDFDDLRFTDDAGTSLSYWTERVGGILRVRYSGKSGHPSNHAGLINDYNYSTVYEKTLDTQINSPRNAADYFNWLYTSHMYVEKEGYWQFAIDGDDGVEVEIDGSVVASWYGAHGFCSCYSYAGQIYLTSGWHKIIVRHEEDSGGDGLILYFRAPGDTSWQTFSTENLKRKALLFAHIPADSELKTAGFIQNGLSTREQSATVWVRVPSIPASSKKTIYMYYGNPEANSASNGANTFNFFDGFEGASLGSQWIANANNYSVSGSVLRINVGAVRTANPLSFNLNFGYILEGKVVNYATASNYGGTLTGVSSSYTQSSNAGAAATVLYMRNGGSSNVYSWIGNGSSTGYNIAVPFVFTSLDNNWYVLGEKFHPQGVVLTKDYINQLSYNFSWSKNPVYITLGAFHGSSSYDIQDTGYDWVRVRKYTSLEPNYLIKSEETSLYVEAGGCFPYGTGCQQKESPTCQSGYCLPTISFQTVDYCNYETVRFFDYNCSGGNCQLISSDLNPSCDIYAPTVSLEARDNTSTIIADGAEINPSLTNKVTLNSVAYDNYALQSHQLQYRKNGGDWESCQDLDNDGNYDVGECTNNDLSFNLEVVNISRAFISIKIGPFNNGDIIDYKVMAVDTAQPVPFSKTVQKYFTVLIPNTPPTATPSTITVYPNANDYWKGENKAANCWKSLQARVTWIYNDADADPQDAYQIEVYNDPVLRDPAHLVEDSCNKTGIGPPGTCASGNFSNEYIITLLEYGESYWWRVKVFDGRDWSNWQEANGLDFSTPSHPYPTVDFNFNPLSPNVSEMVTFTQDSDCYTAADPNLAVVCGTGGATMITHIGWDFYRVTDTQPNPPNGVGESLNISIDNAGGINPTDTYNYTYYSNITYRVYLEIEDQDGYRCSLIKKITVGGMKYPWWKEILPK